MSADSQLRGPVYVDLDGTLIASDMLWESLCLFLRQRPFEIAHLPIWLLGGRATFKAEIARRVSSDPETLPYRPEVLDYLQGQRQQGREVVLATASHRRIADAIANHLGLFGQVLASEDDRNLKGEHKLAEIEKHAGNRPFEYLGNSSADLPVWERAALATLVAPTRAAKSGAARLAVPQRELEARGADGRPLWRVLIKALRLHQWIKNTLLFAPLVLAHKLGDTERLATVALAFLCFSAVASATYLLNDLLDIEADRRHPTKRNRPFASGTLSIPVGFAVFAGLLGGGFLAAALLLPPAATGMLLLYLIVTSAYSFYLKERLLIDVFVLAGLYTLRVLTGAVAADVPASPWLLAFSTFFFLSLALVKRYVELLTARAQNRETLARRSYRVEDVSLVETMGLSSGYLSVLVLCLYVSNEGVTRLYPHPDLLWLISPIMLYWITRMWFLARRESLPDDPVLFASTDRVSYAMFGAIAAIAALAAW